MKDVQLSLFAFPDFYEEEISDSVIIPTEEPDLQEEFELRIGDERNISKSVPKLYQEQVEDVCKVEKRFFVDKEKGMLLTNGTGTGKTLVGLGVAKRFLQMGKGSILVIVPTDQKCKDWVEEAHDMGIVMRKIADTSDYTPGFNVTTYANFYQNDNMLNFHYDLIIYDESHYLLQNAKGKETVYLDKHKKISKLPSVFKRMLLEDEDYYAKFSREEVAEMFQEFVQSTKVLYLSASPFAYIRSLILGDGTLWPIFETNEHDDVFNRARRNVGPEEQFYIDHFGYRMRYGKLTVPESGVDMNLMERMFYEKYKNKGAISGRQIAIDKDYSRDFILLDSEIGNKIDEGVREMSTQEFAAEFPLLSQYYKKKWRYHFTRQLLENIKAKMSIDRIHKHLELGRKVVVFHDYNVSNLNHPFRFVESELITKEEEEKDRTTLQREIDRFHQYYTHLTNLDLSDLISPINLFTEKFGDRAVLYNGTIPNKKRTANKNSFCDDNSNVDVILIQRKAGKEGISLHDVTGNKQRVLIELGLPIAPTDCIQVEGRIYRIGSESNAIYEYMTIQTAFERMAYAHTIAERSRTAENLSMGEKARNMEIIFKEGYQNPTEDNPSVNQGVGGKEYDNSLDEISEFQKSISYYYSNLKKTSKNKSEEGLDYFATPEPLGYKMVEWLYGLPGNRFLEPSAGHGAIGRFFPVLGDNIYIEQSYQLSSKLRLNVESGEVHNMNFENLSKWNKFDKIAMNPPFGVSGKLASSHLRKAIVEHLHYPYKPLAFSRLIAIVPNGNSMDARLRAFSLEKEFQNCVISHEIILPSCTFERAGTTINCKVIVVDIKSTHPELQDMNFYNEEHKKIIDLSHHKNINDFFNDIEHLQITNYNGKD